MHAYKVKKYLFNSEWSANICCLGPNKQEFCQKSTNSRETLKFVDYIEWKFVKNKPII